ncbi:AI-2E family transporter [Chelativorans sp. AA-79]|uniref:AI-2E family transporter n=1 Tax=Chelativorans sp. AA-79 TaxID=3028735 RepID=UPI0023F7CEF4|nr:AI-2E family transporter [Chelativorans sp. AA-79]WEX10042.1 AI-2E family transporter [Chelativorans sp. AA-79]
MRKTVRNRKLPAVSFPPKSGLDQALARGAQVAVIGLAVLAILVGLHSARFLLAPVSLAIVVGLMLGPVAQRLENRGAPSSVSAVATVLVFILIVGFLAAAVATPLTSWAGRVPQIWSELRLQLSSLSEPLETIRGIREQIRSATGGSNVTVSVEEGSPMESVAVLAPTLIAQVLIFLASLYFFVATRHDTRMTVLRLCSGRLLRWRVAHIFRDVEELVSHYLLAITIINIGLGCAVGIALWLAGVPSAPLWGALAGLLNFIVYIGPAVMAVILLGIGVATFDTSWGSLLPLIIYLVLNGIEAQFVTPTVIGRRMTLNPFLVFLSVAFWLWIWGPVGGFVAIPALLVFFAIARNMVPGLEWTLSKERRRQYSRLP